MLVILYKMARVVLVEADFVYSHPGVLRLRMFFFLGQTLPALSTTTGLGGGIFPHREDRRES